MHIQRAREHFSAWLSNYEPFTQTQQVVEKKAHELQQARL